MKIYNAMYGKTICKTTGNLKYAKKDARDAAFAIAMGKRWMNGIGHESKELIELATKIKTAEVDAERALGRLNRWELSKTNEDLINDRVQWMKRSEFKKADKKVMEKALTEAMQYIKIVEVDYETMKMSYIVDEALEPDEETVEFEQEWERK